jgi:hypothetical protein
MGFAIGASDGKFEADYALGLAGLFAAAGASAGMLVGFVVDAISFRPSRDFTPDSTQMVVVLRQFARFTRKVPPNLLRP